MPELSYDLTASKVSVCSVRREQVTTGFSGGSDITLRNSEITMIANAGDVTRPHQHESRIKRRKSSDERRKSGASIPGLKV